jgi:hydroxypyruvate reductase
MPRTAEQLRADALAIWQAGVRAVRSVVLVRENVEVHGDELRIGDDFLPLADIDRIVVVGAGKAGAGMAAGLEQALGERLLQAKQVRGWLNVPADCVKKLQCITLHAARPAGVNEPTAEGVRGAQEMLQLVSELGPRDLCIALISGGGSALLPAPIDGVSLADKLHVTRFLSAAGANIAELNTVRKQLSRIKGGGLARACGAGRLYSLIISDVLGDPLDIIASGPTVDDTSTPREALAVLEKFGGRAAGVPESVFAALEHRARETDSHRRDAGATVRNIIIGNNAVAVDAAGVEAERRGYSHAMHAATKLEGSAEDVGRHLAAMALRMRDQEGPDCLITGGEPTVELADAAIRGKGGRNQQLVLAALVELQSQRNTSNPLAGICLLSGGTDGEDGPTDAAGALIDSESFQQSQSLALDASDYLHRNDAYHFFAPLGTLLKTGPTHTNVCDIRVVVVAPASRR